MKLARIILVLAALAGCSSGSPPHSKVGVAVQPPPGRVVGFDPSVVGFPAAIGTTVYDSAGIISWYKYGASNTAWRPIPVSSLVTGDPSQSPGLKAPIGFVVTMTDGSASWVKSGASDTAWTTNPSGSSITVADGGGISVNDAGAISADPQFGPNVSVVKPNGSGASKTIWNQTCDYTSNVNGAEASQCTLSLINGGSASLLLTESPNNVMAPSGVYDGVQAHTLSGISVGVNNTGLNRVTGSGYPALYSMLEGVPAYFADSQGASASTRFTVAGTFGSVVLTDGFVARTIDHLGAVSLLQLDGNFGGGETGVTIGNTTAANATSATGPFLEITTSAGKPTGVPSYVAGHAAIQYDTTDKELCIYSPTAAAWQCSAAFNN